MSEEYYFFIDVLRNVTFPWVLKYAGTSKNIESVNNKGAGDKACK
jgi:hypothetical protein